MEGFLEREVLSGLKEENYMSGRFSRERSAKWIDGRFMKTHLIKIPGSNR